VAPTEARATAAVALDWKMAAVAGWAVVAVEGSVTGSEAPEAAMPRLGLRKRATAAEATETEVEATKMAAAEAMETAAMSVAAVVRSAPSSLAAAAAAPRTGSEAPAAGAVVAPSAARDHELQRPRGPCAAGRSSEQDRRAALA